MNRKTDKFSLILDDHGQGNCILSFPLPQNKVLRGVTCSEDRKTLHKVAEGCNLLGKPKILHNIFQGKKEKSEESLQFNDQDCS